MTTLPSSLSPVFLIYNLGAALGEERRDDLPDKSPPAFHPRPTSLLSLPFLFFSGKQPRCLAKVPQDSTQPQNGGLSDRP